MNINLNIQEAILMVRMLSVCDPTGLFLNELKQKLINAIEAESKSKDKNEKVEIVER